MINLREISEGNYSKRFKLFLKAALAGFIVGVICQGLMLWLGRNIYLAVVQGIATAAAILSIFAFLIFEWKSK